MYRTLFDNNIYGSYKLSKNSPFFGPPCIIPKLQYQLSDLMRKFFQPKIYTDQIHKLSSSTISKY